MKKWVMILWLGFLTATVDAAEVRQYVWGFDGTVVPERMNLFSALVENDTPRPFDGVILLSQNRGIGSRVGETFSQPCYLSPYARRWVQFLVYVSDHGDSWELELKPETSQPVRLTAPKESPPAQVVLMDPEVFLSGTVGLKRFSENLFPVSVSGTDGLYAVVLDHEPRWELAKRQAFIEWVRRGGTVHLAKAPDGEWPVFSAELTELNLSGPSRRVGAGRVVAHDRVAGEIDETYLATRGYPAPKLEQSEGYAGQHFTRQCFEALRRDVRPKHNWPVIYGMTIAYILLIGPVGMLLGRRVRDFRIATGYTLAVIAAFSAVFLVIGRRGYGEEARITTIGYARPVAEAAWDVTQWGNLFVTRGAWYTVQHPSPHNYYATCQEYERVNGAVQSGREGFFRVDIPLFSSREFLHRGRFEGVPLKLQQTVRTAGDQLEALRVQGELPEGVKSAVAYYRDRFYSTRVSDKEISILGSNWQGREQYFANLAHGWGWRPRGDDEALDTDRLFKHLISTVVGNTGVTPNSVTPPDRLDQVQLFIFAVQPDAFRANMGEIGMESGWVCYHLSLNTEGSHVQ